MIKAEADGRARKEREVGEQARARARERRGEAGARQGP